MQGCSCLQALPLVCAAGVSSLLGGRGCWRLYLPPVCFPKSVIGNVGGGGSDGSLGFSYPCSSHFVNVFTSPSMAFQQW